METPAAAILYRDDKRSVVLCPYCETAEHVRRGAALACQDGKGEFRIGERYDFKTARVALARREADCRRKREERASRRPPKEVAPTVE